MAYIERALSEEDAFGGPELRRIAILMATAFAMGGRASAPGEEPEQWLKNPAAYANAMGGVLQALMAGVSPQDAPLVWEAIKSKFLTMTTQRKESRK